MCQEAQLWLSREKGRDINEALDMVYKIQEELLNFTCTIQLLVEQPGIVNVVVNRIESTVCCYDR